MPFSTLHTVIPSEVEESRGNEAFGLSLYLLSPRGGVDFPESGKGGSRRLTKRGRLRRGAVSKAKNERLTIED